MIEAFKEALQLSGGTDSDIFQVEHGVHPDLLIVAPESKGKSLGVDEVRRVVTQALMYPTRAPYRFFVLDDVDQMTEAASNALLKTLEELTAKSRFFLLTKDYNRILPTVRSRCHRIDFQRLPEAFVVDYLVKAGTLNASDALVYARMSDGSIGKAIRYHASNHLTHRDRAIEVCQWVGKDLVKAFSIVDEEEDLSTFLELLCIVVHDCLVYKVASKRVVNQDRLASISELHGQVGFEVWVALWLGLKKLTAQLVQTPLNVSFQLKTVLSSSRLQ